MVDNLDNGQLNVKLDLIIDQLDKLTKNMVTKDVFEMWKEGNAERIARLEQDLARWIQESTAAHVSLDKDSKARHAETIAADREMRTYVDTRFENEENERENISEKQKDRKNAMVGVVVGVIATAALGIASIAIQIVQAVVH